MNVAEFKRKLDSRDFSVDDLSGMWEAARKWENEVNKEDAIIEWSWDCNFKLDYDGSVCLISSRFYPPHKNSIEECKYSGTITVMIGDLNEVLHEHEIEAVTLDELQKKVEDYVSELLDKMHNAIRGVFL